MTQFIQLLGFGLLAAAGNLIGGYLITGTAERTSRLLRSVIGIGAGFMLGAVFLDVIPDIARQWSGDYTSAMTWVLAGYLLVQFAEHTIAPHFHFGEETHKEDIKHSHAASAAVFGLSVHTFFDGVAIASGFLTDFKLGLLLSIAILIHKIPEGFTVASIMLASGKGKQGAWRATILISLATFLGIFGVTLVTPIVKYTLPISAGVTLFVAASDLLPEVNRKGGANNTLPIFGGVGLFYITHLLLHEIL